MTHEANDEQAPASSRVLTSEGKLEAQAYATTELHDSVRPTMEMDRVQITDPRKQITVKTARPPAAAMVPPMPRMPRSAVPDLDDEQGLRPTLARDDEMGLRPTLLRDDGGEHPTIPLVTHARAVSASAPRRSALGLAVPAFALLALAGAWLALTPRRDAGDAMRSPSAAPATPADTTPAASAAPATPPDSVPAASAAPATPPDNVPAASAAPATPPDNVPAASAAPATAPAEPPHAAAPKPAAPRPTAAPKPAAPPPAAPPPAAPAPPPTAPAPTAKGRLFGVDE